MDISIILMGVGILCIIISFFLKDKTHKLENDIEDLSINVFQETNSLKRRLKVVEEELLLDHNFQVKPTSNAQAAPKFTQPQQTQAAPKQDPMTTFKQVAAQVKAQQTKTQGGQNEMPVYTPPTSPPQENTKPVHSILVNQVIELNKQGLAIDEICRLSTLSQEQVRTILANNGGV